MAFVTCAPKALRTACSPALSRRGYVEMMGAAPSKGERSSIRGMAGLAAAVVLGGAGYMYYAGGADPKSLKEAESKLAALATGDKGGEDKAKAAATAVASGSGSALSKSEFRNFKLEKVEPYNHNTSIFTFALPEGQDSGLTVASALLTRSANEGACVDGKGRPVMRPYTPTTAPSEKGKIELIVKKYKDGAMTNHIHSLTPGDELAMKGPLPKHPWKANEFEKIALVMGGSGLTPGWQILQQIAADPEDKTKATLIYSNVTEADILLRKELDELAAKHPDQFRIVYSLDKPPRGWSGEKGWLSADLLKKYLPLPGLSDKIKIFVCGPPGQVEAVCGAKKSPSDQGELKGAMADLGYQSSQVYKF